ncbi:MAG TPA: DUF917 domain-containing protein [Methylomirabilota bacterium]|jgi:DUF917 family protein|nr:DUF917 domain-containing protein [Methylomirabilota bacterium]
MAEADFDALALGAWILGTGGGGDPYHSLLEIQKLHREGHRVSLMDPLDLGDDQLVAVVGQMGAPLVIQERMTDAGVMAETIRMMERHLGRRFEAIAIWEIGGNNAFQPFLAAALLGLPVVDADAMGRAFPQADMTTFAICDLPSYPWTMVDVRRNSLIFTEAEDWSWMERLTRKACTVLGSVAATCKAPRTGREIKTCTILHTASKAMRIGRLVQDARARHADPIAVLIEAEHGLLIFRGKVRDVYRRTTEGYLRGSATIEGTEAWRESALTLDFQNEFTVGRQDGAVRVTVPDLICVLDTESGEAIGTETLRYGQRVTVVALPAPPLLVSAKGLRHVGPRAFGYDLDFRSIFERAER